MEVKLRFAKIGDCARLMELVNELAVFEKAPHEVVVSLAEFKEAGFGQQPVWKAFVAEVDDYIVGFALYYTRYSTWKGRRIYLEDLLVTQNMRGKGIGKLLFDAVVKQTKELGYSGMVWQVLDWNQPAIDFYNKYQAGLEAGWLNASLPIN
ncbi:L-amino acid N-acyltransferase YncA [Mucilaginibacter gracilis]|uniref:L-amino acid N-acyltransferase YncA n=1 Tax=Mucilaginibacter gracilis TaxID=423350 RepID=A0A495JBU8_9SPHI|nr:GNAT family N-acetyltransferase [Mucilaginibacter gracilis]RKR85539.1 L-amino acid N-acyltransferase YncA [Mucilaginibacter gracilis]